MAGLLLLILENGRKLWEFMTDAGVNAPPAIFEHEGEQYVAVLSAGNLLAGSKRGDSVWLFGLESSGIESAIEIDQVTTPLSSAEGQLLWSELCLLSW